MICVRRDLSFDAPNNPAAPKAPNPVDAKIAQCKAEANASAGAQPSAIPNGNSLFTGAVNSAVSAARTGNWKGAVIGFVQGLLVRIRPRNPSCRCSGLM